MRILPKLLIAVMISVILCGYSDAAEKRTPLKPTGTTKGAKQGMKTYYMGRFAIDLPAEFKLEIQSQKIRYAEVSDFKWKERDRAKERESLWTQKLAKIKKLQLPKGRKQIIIEEKHLKGIGSWAKTVEYYGDYRIGDYIYWTVLVDYGESGLWLTLYGLNNHKSLKNFNNILTHYQYGFDNLTKDSFCLNHGRIELPYLEHERTYARFAGPMDMKLEIEMHEIHREPQHGGIISRTAAAMATGFARDIDIEKIRSRERIIAGLNGEEEILKGDDGSKKDLSFDWEYLGKVESGEQPWIQITVDTEPDNLDEKIRLWDRALDSFRPAYKH